MKKLVVLVTAFFLFGFSNFKEEQMILKATKIEPLGPNKCSVSLELHNNMGRKINYLSMYCSDAGFYVTDNPDVVVSPKPCDKNFPTSVMIAKNSYRMANLELEVLKKVKQVKFKIGFKFVEIPKGISLSAFDSSSVNSITVWSNTIEYKGR